MHEVWLHPPAVVGREARFRFDVDPPTALYRQRGFTLRFPHSIDLGRVPDPLWWWIALACLHAHWVLLRPCRVRLPVRLRPGEAEVWCRLVDAGVATLEACRGSRRLGREVELIEAGAPLAPLARLEDRGRCGTAFSGGKDSLLQAGLLAELTREPVLVTTTSPLPPMEDHLSRRRRQVLREVTARRPVTLVEVESDYRAAWDNGFARRLGYPISVNEISDTFLYTGALAAAGVALGATHLFLASEAEVQENVELDGRVVQHRHFMYSAVSQRVLQALLAPAGIRYGSLTVPLHSFQVQELLWTRYPDLADLQYSCWRVRRRQAACERCSQCLRVALCAVAVGDTPARMGVDLVSVLNRMYRWRPNTLPEGTTALPSAIVPARLDAQVVRYIQALPPGAVQRTITLGRPRWLWTGRGWLAIRRYARLRERLRALPVGPSPGYRPGFERLLDPLLREPLARIFAERFGVEAEADYGDVLARGDALTRWILEPIGGERDGSHDAQQASLALGSTR